MAEQIFPEPTVGVFIFNPADELLLLKSHKWPGIYVVPGRHVELGERIEEAAVREVKEETGLDAAVQLPLDAYTRLAVEKLVERGGV